MVIPEVFVVLFVIAICGLVLYLVNKYVSLPPNFKTLLNIVVIGVLVWWLLSILGVLGLVAKVTVGSTNLLYLMLIIVGAGVIVWMVNKFIPMEANIAQIFNLVAIIITVVAVVLAILGIGSLGPVIKVGG